MGKKYSPTIPIYSNRKRKWEVEVVFLNTHLHVLKYIITSLPIWATIFSEPALEVSNTYSQKMDNQSRKANKEQNRSHAIEGDCNDASIINNLV